MAFTAIIVIRRMLMPFLDSLTEIHYIIFGAALLSIFIVLFLVFKKKKPKTDVQIIDVNQLLEALGGAKNITDLSSEHQRLKVVIKDIKRVQQDVLKALEIPAFLKGKELTLLIKHHTKEILLSLTERRKEVN
ncbi:MAG TPA: hypothetical protein DEA30_06100 [Acholeplasmataceae bacterium]|nr:hypothetical protein [Acholeplasmataceae bacterium]